MPKLKNHFPRTYSMVRLVFNKESYLYKSGWMESLKRGYPSDRKGNPLPWMNGAVVRILDERLNPGLRLFEYGCGYSTLFYAKRTERVVSVEHNESWAKLVNDQLPKNAEVLVKPKQEYAGAIHTIDQMFDVVIVDGIDRVNCMMNGLQRLNETGVLLLDDSSRKEYNEGIDYAKKQGFKSLTFSGLKPTGIGVDETTIFYRTHNCFGI